MKVLSLSDGDTNKKEYKLTGLADMIIKGSESNR